MARFAMFSAVLTLSVLVAVNCVPVPGSLTSKETDQQGDQQGGESKRLRPIIILPGIEGSQLEAKLNKTKTVHFLCENKSKGFFNLWLNPEEFVPMAIDCFADNMKLRYNQTTRMSADAEGVTIRVPSFGDTKSIETLSEELDIKTFSYFHNMVTALVKQGYERSVSVRGAPYDYRKSPHEQEEYFRKLTALVEETYAINGDTSAVLVCHSMGCLYSLYFLNHKTDEWKSKYVRSLFAIAAPWGGSVKAVKGFASGDNLGVFLYSNNKLRDMERTFPSMAFLLPSAKVWDDNEALVTISNKTLYSADHYKRFFDAIGDSVGYEMWLDTRDLVSDLKHPGVDVSCIYGSGVKTGQRLHYENETNFPDTPKIITGDGDGTVNIRSLEACLRWKEEPDFEFNHQVFPKGAHLDIVRQKLVIDYMIDFISKL